MATNKLYVAIGEEAVRGTAEVTTVGFLPVNDPTIPKLVYDDKPRADFRGEQTLLGEVVVRRESKSWSYDLGMDFFTEAGTTAGIIGTILKHFFGKVTSVQNGATGQYYHMFYPVVDPFSTSNLGTKALTVSSNYNEGSSMINHPYRGGRVSKISFSQEVGQSLIFAVSMFGQTKADNAAELGSESFAAENLRCDYSHLGLYTGTITRTGTAPDYTEFAIGSATKLAPYSLTIDIENGITDHIRNEGLTYANKTKNTGQMKCTVSFKYDFEDPASGFSSVDEFNSFISDTSSSNNFFALWDTGTQAGTGDNHVLMIDLSVCRRVSQPDQERSRESDPMVTFAYECLMDLTTTEYMVGVMLKNTASTV